MCRRTLVEPPRPKPTDITEDTIRNTALAAGLVDVKVCAVDDEWSGLKLVYRRKAPLVLVCNGDATAGRL